MFVAVDTAKTYSIPSFGWPGWPVGQKRRRQGLGKGKVGGVVGRSAVAEPPNTWQEEMMRVSVQWQVQQVL
jgi:hypothetical protein